MQISVGDTVFVCDRGKPRAISTVTRVMKRFVELEDGSKWLPDGVGKYPYRRWDFTGLRQYLPDSPELPALMAECNRHLALQRIKSTNFETLDTDAIIKIASIINLST